MGMSVREKPAIEDEDAAYFRPARKLAPFRALKATPQEFRDNNRGKVKGDKRCGPDIHFAPDRLYEIGACGSGIRIILGLVAIAHTDILDEELWHLGRIRQMRLDFRPPKRAIGKSRQKGNGARKFSLPP